MNTLKTWGSCAPGFERFLDELSAYDQKMQEYIITDQHYKLHSDEHEFHISERFIECEICSGLPPWEWKQVQAFVEVWPIASVAFTGRSTEYKWPRPHVRWNITKKNPQKKYVVLFTAFGWRSLREWGQIEVPFEKCSSCGKWSRIARHQIKLFHGYSRYRESSICLKCIRKEEREAKKQDQTKEVKRLIKILKKGA